MTIARRELHEAPDSFIIDNLTNGTGSAIAAWTPFAWGGGILIARNDWADGATDGVGIYNVQMHLPATTADAWSPGDDLYWNFTTGKLTDVPAVGADVVYIGKAVAAKVATTQTSAEVLVLAPPAISGQGHLKNVETAVAGGTLVIPTEGLVQKTTGGVEALTLADGTYRGQRVKIILASDGGDGTLTPATGYDVATIVFADAGDMAYLEWLPGRGWHILALAGAAAPPVITV